MADLASLKAALDAAKAKADAATKAYQNTPSYAENYAQIKVTSDSAVNDLNAAQAAYDAATAPKKKPSVKIPAANSATLLDQKGIWEEIKQNHSALMDQHDVGTPEYQAAKAAYDEADAKIQQIDAAIQTAKTAEGTAAQEKKTQKEVKTATDKVTQLQQDKQRLLDKDPKADTSNIDNAIADAKKKTTPTAENGTTSVDFSGKTIKGVKQVEAGATTNTTGDNKGTGKQTSSGQSSQGSGNGNGQTTPNKVLYSKTAPKGTVGVDTAGNYVDANGRILGTSVAPAISTMPKGAVGIANGNWVDSTGKVLGSATPSSGPQGPNQDTYQKFRTQYASEAAIIDANPELKAAFNQALGATGAALSAANFQALYENSNYYKNSYASFISAEDARLAQPGSYANAYNTALANIKTYAAQAGISLDWSSPDLQPITTSPGTSNPLATKQFDPTKPGIVDDILHKYWDTGANQQAITQYLASKGKIDPTIMGGKAQTDEQTLRAFAAEQGLSNLSLPGSDDYFNKAAQAIAKGGLADGTPTDINYWKQDITNKAKDIYGGKYNTQLDAGQTIKSLAAPYINTLTNLLESSPDTIDLSASNGDGALIRNAMQKQVDPETFRNQVMNDPRWLNTKNAKDSLMGLGNQFLGAFGLSAL